MGSLSRNFDGWRNYVHLHTRNLGPGGQMATLMHEELESISDHARDIASTQRRGVETMRAGFDQMTDAVGHLAWVQQRAHEAQLTAQYRLMQLQDETIGELGRANDTLIQVSSQLAEVAEILQAISDTQEEHVQSVKAERTLKEVLFQLSMMLEEMIIPDDEVARLALCHVALDQLDDYGLGTSHLSDLEDKRAFAAFVKSTRKVVRDTPEEVQADLLAFETWHKGYMEARLSTPMAFTPLPAPQWRQQPAPQWKPQKGPTWEEREEPALQLKTLRPKPAECVHPGDHPLPEQFGPMPKQIFVGTNLVDYPYQQVTPGFFTPDTVPTVQDTQTRVPKKGRGFMQFLDSVFCSAEWTNAQNFEDALRSWAKRVKQHESYIGDLAAWEAEAVEIARENEVIARTRYPAELEKFRSAEIERRRQYEANLAAFKAKERERKAAHDRTVTQHEEQEKQRHAAWQEKVRQHELAEQQRYQGWTEALNAFVSAFQAQGKLINEFLEEHPDLQLLYGKVDWEKDSTAVRNRVPTARRAELPEGCVQSAGEERETQPAKEIEKCPLCGEPSFDLRDHYARKHPRAEGSAQWAQSEQPQCDDGQSPWATGWDPETSQWNMTEIQALGETEFAKGRAIMKCHVCGKKVRTTDLVRHFEECH